jgi:flagellar motor switch protein FliM
MKKIVYLLASIGLLVQLPLSAWAYMIPTPLVNLNETVGDTVNKIEVTVPNTTKPSDTQTQTINQATVIVPTNLKSTFNSTINKDANIKRVEVKDDKLNVDYQQATKILGLIPAKFNLHISADTSKKQLHIGRPWWTILSNTNVRKIFDNLQAGMNTVDKMNLSATPQKLSQSLQTISTVMKNYQKTLK